MSICLYLSLIDLLPIYGLIFLSVQFLISSRSKTSDLDFWFMFLHLLHIQILFLSGLIHDFLSTSMENPTSFSISKVLIHQLTNIIHSKLADDNFLTWKSLMLPVICKFRIILFLDGFHPCFVQYNSKKWSKWYWESSLLGLARWRWNNSNVDIFNDFWISYCLFYWIENILWNLEAHWRPICSCFFKSLDSIKNSTHVY